MPCSYIIEITLGRYSKIYLSKFCGIRHEGGGGVRAGKKDTKGFFKKCFFFQKSYRIILGPPKPKTGAGCMRSPREVQVVNIERDNRGGAS